MLCVGQVGAQWISKNKSVGLLAPSYASYIMHAQKSHNVKCAIVIQVQENRRRLASSTISEPDPYDYHKLASIIRTAGRFQRWLGWINTALAKTSACLNGLESFAVTKLNVLDSLEEIKVGIANWLYRHRVRFFSSSLDDLQAVEPVYQTLFRWHTSAESINFYQTLSTTEKLYLKTNESLFKDHSGLISLDRNKS